MLFYKLLSKHIKIHENMASIPQPIPTGLDRAAANLLVSKTASARKIESSEKIMEETRAGWLQVYSLSLFLYMTFVEQLTNCRVLPIPACPEKRFPFNFQH